MKVRGRNLPGPAPGAAAANYVDYKAPTSDLADHWRDTFQGQSPRTTATANNFDDEVLTSDAAERARSSRAIP